MTHHMKLHSEPFGMIASGEKTIELRLYDEKRQKLKLGDTIIFTNSQNPEQTVTATIKGLHRFQSFAHLYAALPLERCGYTRQQLTTAHPDDMYAYYTRQQEQQYGVVGIEINIITE